MSITPSSCQFCIIYWNQCDNAFSRAHIWRCTRCKRISRRETLSCCCLFPPVYQLLQPPTSLHCACSASPRMHCSVAACLSKVGNSFRVHKHLLGFLNATITIFSPPVWPKSPPSSSLSNMLNKGQHQFKLICLQCFISVNTRPSKSWWWWFGWCNTKMRVALRFAKLEPLKRIPNLDGMSIQMHFKGEHFRLKCPLEQINFECRLVLASARWLPLSWALFSILNI